MTAWVAESDFGRVQGRALDERGGAPVDSVSQHRVADVGEVDPDLVGAPGQKANLKEAVSPGQRETAELRDRLPPPGDHCHPLAAPGIAPDWRFDPGRPLRHLSDDDRQVEAMHAAPLQLLAEVPMRDIVAGHDEETRGVPVEPVDNTRALSSPNGRPALAPRQEPVDERASGMPGTRMNDQPGGFVEHHQVLILIDHVQSYGLWGQHGGRRGWKLPGQVIPDVKARAGARDGGPVEAHMALGDQPLHVRPAEIGKQPGKVLVES